MVDFLNLFRWESTQQNRFLMIFIICVTLLRPNVTTFTFLPALIINCEILLYNDKLSQQLWINLSWKVNCVSSFCRHCFTFNFLCSQHHLHPFYYNNKEDSLFYQCALQGKIEPRCYFAIILISLHIYTKWIEIMLIANTFGLYCTILV